jgi:hypothetical protein
VTESLEQRLRRLADKLDAQGAAWADLEKGEESSGANLRSLQKELADLKQITPQHESKARPVIVADVSKSGLPSDVESAIRERLRGNITENALYHALGFGT